MCVTICVDSVQRLNPKKNIVYETLFGVYTLKKVSENFVSLGSKKKPDFT
jgi:hypothetical protein